MSNLHTQLLAALGLVGAGIRDSCSGYAGFRPWLLSARPRRQRNAKTRVDERSTRDLAFYPAFGRAGPCRGGNLFRLRWFPALVAAFRAAAAPGKRQNARR